MGVDLYNFDLKMVKIVLSGGDSVGGSIREEDYGGGPNIPGTAEIKGKLQIMRERDGDGVIGVEQGDTAWAGGRGAVELGSVVHGRRAADVPDGL